MGELHELRLRHNKFTDNLDVYIEEVIDDNQALLDLNRKQLKEEHKDVFDYPIEPPYSYLTAQKKGFSTPDLYDTGRMFDEMTIEAKGTAFFINSGVEYARDLKDKYGAGTFGIARSMQSIAKEITTDALGQIYIKLVYKR